jgi:hypothetical protein
MKETTLKKEKTEMKTFLAGVLMFLIVRFVGLVELMMLALIQSVYVGLTGLATVVSILLLGGIVNEEGHIDVYKTYLDARDLIFGF